MRTITAPGIQINEIDKSQYSPAMTGTACYILGFANKGEAYIPMEFTSRSAWVNYYGSPKTEAERYFYAAACETLNQNGRLYCARLPYDNESFEKMVACKYTVTNADLSSLNTKIGYDYHELSADDKTINKVAIISSFDAPYLASLSEIDEYRAGEKKPGSNHIIIVDKTCGTLQEVIEDTRKGKKREFLGIVPVITTAANAMYAQSLIDVANKNARYYENVGPCLTLESEDLEAPGKNLKNSNYISASTVNKELAGTPFDGLSVENIDLVRQLNSAFKVYTAVSGEAKISIVDDMRAYTKDLLEDFVPDYAEISSLSAFATAKSVSDFTMADAGTSAIKTESLDIKIDDSQLTGGLFAASETIVKEEAPKTVTIENIKTAIDYIKETDKFKELLIDKDISDLYDKIKNDYTKLYTEKPANADPEAVYFQITFAGSTENLVGTDIGEGHTLGSLAAEILAVYGICHSSESTVDGDVSLPDTVSLEANGYFSTLVFNPDTETYERDNLKKIGVVVYKTYIDPAAGNKIVFEAVESYCGSLYKDDKDPNTGASTFIDTIVNTNSDYIYFFSNCFNQKTSKKYFTDTLDILISVPTDNQPILGFFTSQTEKYITVDKSIYDGMNKAFEKNSDVIERDIDIVCDAGIANIASYMASVKGYTKYYDLTLADEDQDPPAPLINKWKVDGNTLAVKTWKAVEQKFDNFCKNIRKDCMFIADGLRPLVLQGDKKIVRPSKPTNSLDVNVIPYLKYVSGLNTSYGAGYIDWFEQADDYSGDFFWCPPSIKAMGVYIYTDVNFNYWDAPAGLTRGVIAATDVAFSPSPKQAGCFYEKNWNYAINYPNDGIVLEGQKTLQVKPTAVDRVNVRRLALRLERMVFKNLRYFLYEGNTAYLRQRVVDSITPYFKEARVKGGLYDYKIICDESNNTSETIDRNELHVSIGIKPVKTVEFIMVSFILASTGANWEEVMG